MCMPELVIESAHVLCLLFAVVAPTSCPSVPTNPISNGAWPGSCAGAAIGATCTAQCVWGGTATVQCLSTGFWSSTVTGTCDSKSVTFAASSPCGFHVALAGPTPPAATVASGMGHSSVQGATHASQGARVFGRLARDRTIAIAIA
jgi:hypothetical protein